MSCSSGSFSTQEDGLVEPGTKILAEEFGSDDLNDSIAYRRSVHCLQAGQALRTERYLLGGHPSRYRQIFIRCTALFRTISSTTTTRLSCPSLPNDRSERPLYVDPDELKQAMQSKIHQDNLPPTAAPTRKHDKLADAGVSISISTNFDTTVGMSPGEILDYSSESFAKRWRIMPVKGRRSSSFTAKRRACCVTQSSTNWRRNTKRTNIRTLRFRIWLRSNSGNNKIRWRLNVNSESLTTRIAPRRFVPYRIAQGYLCSAPERTVRVRLRDDEGFLTVKGPSDETGVSRYEFWTVGGACWCGGNAASLWTRHHRQGNVIVHFGQHLWGRWIVSWRQRKD